MKEVDVSDKQIYLALHYPFKGVPDIDEKRLCIHCDSIIMIGDFKVFKDQNGTEFICCPNAPDCNGTLIDWIDANSRFD